MADTGERLATLEANVHTLSTGLNKHLDECSAAWEKSNERFSRLEKIIWTAAGAVGAYVTVITFLVRH